MTYVHVNKNLNIFLNDIFKLVLEFLFQIKLSLEFMFIIFIISYNL